MELTVEQIARVCHEANRAYAMVLGDHSIPAWDVAPPWQKESALAGVKSVLEEPAKTPEQSHFEWMEHKLKSGWTYGPEKRPEVLQHPCIVPYDQLPEEQRLKDHLFTGIVRALGRLETVSAVELEKAAQKVELPHGDTTQEVGILTPDGEVVKDAVIVDDVVVPKKKGKHRG